MNRQRSNSASSRHPRVPAGEGPRRLGSTYTGIVNNPESGVLKKRLIVSRLALSGEGDLLRGGADVDRHAGLACKQDGVVGLNRMRVDRLLGLYARVQLEEAGWDADHRTLGGQREARRGFEIMQLGRQLAAAGNGRIGDQDQVEQQLDLVLRQVGAAANPLELRL